MKLGDLVRPKRKLKFLTEEVWNATGIIISVLSGGSHRKNTSYEVMWNAGYEDDDNRLAKWHTKDGLELVSKGCTNED